MLSATASHRLASLLADHPILLAYHLHPLPRGVLSAAQGGLALLFAATTSATQRYEAGQRLRFQLMGLMPPGHSETLVLNDGRLALALAAVERGALVYCRDEVARGHYEMIIRSQHLDFTATLQLAAAELGPVGRSS